ncbi:unnamed protein product [Parnassius apollo]|uniref:Malate dehydrogenase, mitochondrial n=1 Tax=Parnassius apollo TaxID=110799 RepID=A0A8S3Y7Y0_PARAO|nr:unnamed protein product [Parnassius apollo]
MFLARPIFNLISKIYILPCRCYQVAIVGSGSEVGQTTALLLRTNPHITKLILYDYLEHIPGIVLDLSHIPSNSTIKGYTGKETLEEALQGSSLVIAAGDVSQNTGWITKSTLSKNADFIKNIAMSVAKISPLPFLGIVTEPLNTLVPMAAEIMRNQGCTDLAKLLGITTIDTIKAQALYAAENEFKPSECFVPVIGGHSKETMVPLISQANPKSKLSEEKNQELIAKLRNYNISDIANGIYAPALSIAFSVSIFTENILEALNGHISHTNAFVENNDFGTSFISGCIEVDKNGVGEMKKYTDLSEHEYVLLQQSIEQLRKDVTVGKDILELA